MFKIAKANLAAPFVSDTLQLSGGDQDLLAQFCFSEGWMGDLSNGIIKLGPLSRMIFGLAQADCGLLNLMRCYDSYDRARILELFEQAATSSSSFCFSTTALAPSGHRQPVFCIGESTGTEEKYAGSMSGVFLFPRFKLDVIDAYPTRQ